VSEFDAKDNWEALFDHAYLRWFNLNDQPALVEIVKVEKNVELTMRGGVKTKKPVVYLKQIKGAMEEAKPLVLNVTNSNSIAAIHGPKPSQWIGKQIVLFCDVAKLQGKDVPCIRIREVKAKTQEIK
jgi:hypothetical protein